MANSPSDSFTFNTQCSFGFLTLMAPRILDFCLNIRILKSRTQHDLLTCTEPFTITVYAGLPRTRPISLSPELRIWYTWLMKSFTRPCRVDCPSLDFACLFYMIYSVNLLCGNSITETNVDFICHLFLNKFPSIASENESESAFHNRKTDFILI